MSAEPYYQPSNDGPRCSTARSERLRQLRFDMGRETRAEPPAYEALSREAGRIFDEHRGMDPAVAKAKAMRYIAANCPMEIDPATVLLGGESPFLFSMGREMLRSDGVDAAVGDRGVAFPAAESLAVREGFKGPCMTGHITPGFETILGQGISGLRRRLMEQRERMNASAAADPKRERWYEAALMSCETVLIFARRCREAALRMAEQEDDPWRECHLRESAEILDSVPQHPARTLHEALQAYWLVHVLATVEMGGLSGGGCGLGRPDQYLYPYYIGDVRDGRLTREQAVELIEIFLLCFQHEDYYTAHQIFTPGCQGSLGGLTPAGRDASNELTEIFMEASLRIHMPTPYLSLRLHKQAPRRYWEAAANYVWGGLGFSVVNDEVVIPALVRHGRSLDDARDYICACCYEHTIPGQEIYHPMCILLNLPLALELALNEGRTLLEGEPVGRESSGIKDLVDMESVWRKFRHQLEYILEQIVTSTNVVADVHRRCRRYPLMSLFFEDCLARGMDVCEGGARYNLTGLVAVGLPNLVNSLAAIEQCVFEDRRFSMADLVAALRANFAGHEELRRHLLGAPKWGNGDDRVDKWAARVSELLYDEMVSRNNVHGGRWQLALFSFTFNRGMGAALGASADGRRSGEILTRNMNPTWGTDRNGPLAVLQSMSRVDWSKFPNGSALDLRFDPASFASRGARETFAGFLKGFVDLGVMQMQITMVDTEILLEARAHPEKWPELMVRVAGFSARFVDLDDTDKNEIIGRSLQQLGG